uniref:EOG090X032R n=1 Tax=Daphnia atkinsoni TaxID=342845 RepID=A0A4Y7M061_9CRUS|nr:EOG090X032R [Daphnia atkinsoni]
MTTSLPVFSILYPSIRRYTVKQTRKSETSVDGQSLERKGGPLLNLLVSVKRVIRTPLFLRWYEALSVAFYSFSESIIFTPKMVKGKKADAPIQTGVGSLAPQVSSASANEIAKELDDTPPPSRPPSPPPSRPPSPTYSSRSRSSEWSIDVEELSDEPRPAIQSRKKKTERERPRSNSWSRSLVNSFRKKKKDKELKREQLYKTEPLPADFSTNVEEDAAVEKEIKVILRAVQPEEEEDVEIEKIMEEIETRGSIEGETVTSPEAIAKAPERNNRMSRILSFGTFGRRKSIQVQQEQVKDDNLDSGIQEYPEMKESEQEKKRQVEEKTEVESKGKDDESDGENGESKPQSKSKLKEKVKSKSEKKSKDGRKEKAEENVEVTPSDAESESSPKITKLNGKEKRKAIKKTKSKQKSIFSFRSSSKTIDQVKSHVDTNTEQLNQEQSIENELQPPESVKPKRRTIANFFKRDKSIKDDAPVTPAADVPNLKKDTRFRSSFARLKKTKSVDAEASPTEDTIEKNRKSKRSTSLAFGSSFSIKKMFQSDSQPATLERGTVSPGILAKRGKGSTIKRPKSVQLDEHPFEIEHAPVASQTELRSSRSKLETQLREIFENPHFTALLETHDAVTEGLYLPDYYTSQEPFGERSFGSFDPYTWEMPADISAVRAVGIRKNPGEPLGLTVKTEDGQLVIARILAGGAVDRQGLLHVGDIIGEVNGVAVRSAEQLQVEIARCREHIQLKILPSFQENGSNGAQCCVRAHFDYDPKEDKLLPCPEIGLAFKKGDILQVVNQSDPNWWQAKKVGWSGPAGLIPSQELEERRKAFVAPEADFVHKIGFCGTRISKKKKKLMYQIKSSVDLDKAELLLYEEVTRMPPFRRKTLVLVGSEGIGRRTLKNRLINSDPDRFGTTMPHTSRPMRELEEDGMGYWFVSREEMEHDVRDHQFLEFGEHNNHIYGTKLDSIRAVIRQGKMCVLDCSPNALKTLHNSPEFMPYVIFLAAPGMDQLKSIYENSRYSSRNLGTFDRSSSIRFSSRRARTLESLTSLYEEEDFKNALEESARIQRIYEKYFDQILINEDPDQTFRKVVEALEILSNQHQWVPVSWVY